MVWHLGAKVDQPLPAGIQRSGLLDIGGDCCQIMCFLWQVHWARSVATRRCQAAPPESHGNLALSCPSVLGASKLSHAFTDHRRVRRHLRTGKMAAAPAPETNAPPAVFPLWICGQFGRAWWRRQHVDGVDARGRATLLSQLDHDFLTSKFADASPIDDKGRAGDFVHSELSAKYRGKLVALCLVTREHCYQGVLTPMDGEQRLLFHYAGSEPGLCFWRVLAMAPLAQPELAIHEGETAHPCHALFSLSDVSITDATAQFTVSGDSVAGVLAEWREMLGSRCFMTERPNTAYQAPWWLCGLMAVEVWKTLVWSPSLRFDPAIDCTTLARDSQAAGQAQGVERKED